MMQRKPLALTMMALFATPLAIPCSASAAAQGGAVSEATTVAEAATSGTTPAAPAATLPQTDVSGASIRDEYQRDMATVGGKVPTAIRDIPQSVTVIDKAVMQAQGATSFADALRNSPAITLGGAEGG